MRTLPLVLLPVLLVLAPAAQADGPEAGAAAAHLSRFGEGAGPRRDGGAFHLLDEAHTPLQSNAVAFDRDRPGTFRTLRLDARLRVDEGGDGGAFLFLDTASYGVRGPAPFLPSWSEPNLAGSFAVGIDVHDPPSHETFTAQGNYQDLPQREVSLHWDGREIVKRVSPAEFRGKTSDLSISVEHVVGGAEVSVSIAGASVYDHYFVPGMTPYECRLAIGAGTLAKATTVFDVEAIRFVREHPAPPARPPLHVEVFNHVLTNSSKTAYDREVDLPPETWAFARVLLTLDIHDAGGDWDEWDRNGEVSVWTDDGTKLGIVPFITSYRTPCHWVVDVTAFRPLLAGRRKIEIAAGTTFYKNRGFMMSVSLDFHHGVPKAVPYRVVPLWVGTAHYRSDENHFQDFFQPREVAVDAEATACRVFLAVTGHSQVGEFTPSKRTLVFAAGDDAPPERFGSRLWKTDCYLNPNRPQFGTWQFSRAGWAPGDVVRPWWVDLTPYLRPGRTAHLRYETEPYDFSQAGEKPTRAQIDEARQVVRAYLILYRTPKDLVPAPTLRIVGVEKAGNAAKAGLKAGDYLQAYDGTPISSLSNLRKAIQAAQAAGRKRVAVVVFRGAERIEVDLPAGHMGIQIGGG
jgi:hypothetical protein